MLIGRLSSHPFELLGDGSDESNRYSSSAIIIPGMIALNTISATMKNMLIVPVNNLNTYGTGYLVRVLDDDSDGVAPPGVIMVCW